MTVYVGRRAIDAIVLDIEGTTTPITFVSDVLFPFARRHLREYLQDQRDSHDVRAVILRLRQDWAEDLARGESPPHWADSADARASSIAAYVEWLMDRDRKSPGLKLLQGHIWDRGYRSGELKSVVFPDVAPAIQRWRASGVKVAIYSSGSALAQRRLFEHVPEGDLTPYLNEFFDTAVGAKTSPDSYGRIAAALQCSTGHMLFVSDAMKEIEAARRAGCQVLLCVRPGNADQSPSSVDAVQSLQEIIVS